MDDKELRENPFLQEKRLLTQTASRRLKSSKKRLEKARSSLEECLNWQKIQHEAQILQSHLYKLKRGMSNVSLPDWENDNQEQIFHLNPANEPHTEVSKRFKISRKFKKGIPYQETLIRKAEKEIADLTLLLTQLENIDSQEALNLLQQHSELLKTNPKKSNSKKNDPAKKLPYKEFLTPSGLSIWVGKSAKDNDLLTFKFAKGSDWWLHVRDFPGSHIIIRVNKGQDPDPESLKMAIQLALRFSKAKGDADVCITQCKYVSRSGKNQPGKVQISKHRISRGTLSP